MCRVRVINHYKAPAYTQIIHENVLMISLVNLNILPHRLTNKGHILIYSDQEYLFCPHHPHSTPLLNWQVRLLKMFRGDVPRAALSFNLLLKSQC